MSAIARTPELLEAVYFVQHGGSEGLIKIGFTTTGITQRLQTLRSEVARSGQTPERLTPLLVAPGDRVVERRLHGRFATLREHGEWFRPEGALVRFIEAARSNPGMVSAVSEVGAIPGAPWRDALVARLVDMHHRKGISKWRIASAAGMHQFSSMVRFLRSGDLGSIRSVEKIARAVECELMVVPKELAPEVERLLAKTANKRVSGS